MTEASRHDTWQARDSYDAYMGHWSRKIDAPKSLISIDSSEGFVINARANLRDERAAFEVGDAQALTRDAASRDVCRVCAGSEFLTRQAEGA